VRIEVVKAGKEEKEGKEQGNGMRGGGKGQEQSEACTM
jgi:hypothetical protein